MGRANTTFGVRVLCPPHRPQEHNLKYIVELEDKRILLDPTDAEYPQVEVLYDDIQDLDDKRINKTFILSNAFSLYNRLKTIAPDDPIFKKIEEESDDWKEANELPWSYDD